MKLAQARSRTAEINFDRSVAEKRPASDLRRLERLKQAELSDIKLLEVEIHRIERANEEAANPVRQAWESVIPRRVVWQYPYALQYTNYWNRLGEFDWNKSGGQNLEGFGGVNINGGQGFGGGWPRNWGNGIVNGHIMTSPYTFETNQQLVPSRGLPPVYFVDDNSNALIDGFASPTDLAKTNQALEMQTVTFKDRITGMEQLSFGTIASEDPIDIPFRNIGLRGKISVIGKIDLDQDGRADRERYHQMMATAGYIIDNEVDGSLGEPHFYSDLNLPQTGLSGVVNGGFSPYFYRNGIAGGFGMGASGPQFPLGWSAAEADWGRTALWNTNPSVNFAAGGSTFIQPYSFVTSGDRTSSTLMVVQSDVNGNVNEFGDEPALKESVRYITGNMMFIQEQGISSDVHVTLTTTGITLGSAVQLLLKPLSLTYVIRRRVLEGHNASRCGPGKQ